MKFYHGVLFTDFSANRPEQHQRTLGAYAVADLLRKRGLNIKVVDFTFSWEIDQILSICKKVVSTKTKFIGLSSTFLSKEIDFFAKSLNQPLDNFSRIVQVTRTINPNIKVIQGGGWAYSPHPLADEIFSGQDSEVKVLEFMAKLFPEFSLNPFDFINEMPVFTDDDFILQKETLPIETARGCIFNCKFCGFTLRGKKKNDYVRSAELIADTIEDLQNRFNTTNFYIAEDTFNESLEKVQALNSTLRSRKLESKFVCYSRLDLIYRYPEMLTQLYEIGVRAIVFGIETFNRKAGQSIGKGLDPDKVKSLLLQIREKYPDLFLASGFIVGLPGEDLESIAQTNRWLTENKALNHWDFQALHLDIKSNNPFRSEFSKNSSLYGYQADSSLGWKMGNLTFLDCLEISEILNETNEREGISKAYPWVIFSALQYASFDHLSQMTNLEIYEKVKDKKFKEYQTLWDL